MTSPKLAWTAGAVGFVSLLLVAGACESARGPVRSTESGFDVGLEAPRDRTALVMTSAFCGTCHPAIYAEHEQNTHGRAFTDEEVRLGTGRFGHGDCIRCHTPRPIFETGIGMNPQIRWHNLREGNTCMTCHLKADHDYSTFVGGAECKSAFDDRVGTVEACASCHRNHGTPYQWAKAPNGKAAGRTCMTCHMETVRRPVAEGEAPRMVRSHVFPGARSETQLRKAYEYEATVDGNEVVVRITNSGAGHHFPTELKQRSVESYVVVRDGDGREVGRSRMVFRDPYKRPYGLTLPVNTQIPPGETREHRVPIKVASGTVDCELHFKHYFPIEDHHPDLSQLLESKRLVFDGVTPSDAAIVTEPEVAIVLPEAIPVEAASPADLVDFVRPAIGKVEVEIPGGNDADAIRRLVELFQFPVPEANRRAQARLKAIGLPAIPALIEALGSWDNKTFNQASHVLVDIGALAVPAVLEAAAFEQPERNSADFNDLFVRMHARALLARLPGVDVAAARRALEPALGATNALDRRSAAEALGALRASESAGMLRPLLRDKDPDVVVAAARALARVNDFAAAPAIERAMRSAFFPETRRDLAVALAELGVESGVPVLLGGLDIEDDLVRESYAEALFSVTGQHLGYDALAPRPDRLAAISALWAWWAKSGGAAALRRPHRPDAETHDHAWKLVTKLAEQDEGGAFDELVALGADAVPALVLGLKYPPGFAEKRVRVINALARIGNADAAPALGSTLRDPVLSVAAWACWALEFAGDAASIEALRRYTARLHTLESRGEIPASAGSFDQLLAQAARTRFLLGDDTARDALVRLLLSADDGARRTAIDGLERRLGERRDYDPDAALEERRAAAARWSEPR